MAAVATIYLKPHSLSSCHLPAPEWWPEGGIHSEIQGAFNLKQHMSQENKLLGLLFQETIWFFWPEGASTWSQFFPDHCGKAEPSMLPDVNCEIL